MFERRRKLAAAAAAVVALFGAVGASAHGGPGGRAFGPAYGVELDAAASFLGLTPAALKAELVAGKTLAQVATDQGKSVADLVAALKAAAVKKLDAAVAAGKLTSAQEATIVAGLTQRLTDLVNRTKPVGRGGPRHGDELATAASFLGLTPAALQAQLVAGKTLAQVATDQGKSVADLVAALKAAAVKELDAAVAAGRLTAAQEATIVATLTQRFTDLVNGTKPVGKGTRHDRWRP
jgi:phosphosulfolactate phosphohydrolase-like enzyme